MNASFFRGPLGLVTVGLVSVTVCVLLLLPAVGHGYLQSRRPASAGPGGDWIYDDAHDGGGGANSWQLPGNIGTNPATDFVGTSDFTDLHIATSSTSRMHILAAGPIEMSEQVTLLAATPPNDLILAGTNSLVMPGGQWSGVTGNLGLTFGNLNMAAGDLIMPGGIWDGTGNLNLTLNMGDLDVMAGDLLMPFGNRWDGTLGTGDLTLNMGDLGVITGAINMPLGSWNAAGNGDLQLGIGSMLLMENGFWDGGTGTLTLQSPIAAGPGGGNLLVSPPTAGNPGGTLIVGTVPPLGFGQTSNLLVTDGAVGIGRLDPGGANDGVPQTLLHVEGVGSPLSPLAAYHHIAFFHSRDNPANTTDSADGIAIQLGLEATAAAAAHNFITFFQTGNALSLGAIEATVVGGAPVVSFQSVGGADFAEGLPKLFAGENLEPGMIVGVYGGKITKDTVGADHIMVISTAPGFVGSAPPDGEEDAYGIVAFMGRVPVLVRAPVSSGDLILASGMADGTAIAVNPADLALEDMGDVVGRAWSDLEGGLLGYVNVVVGVNSAVSGAQALPAQIAKVQELQDELDRTQSQLAAMSRRLAQLEAAIAD